MPHGRYHAGDRSCLRNAPAPWSHLTLYAITLMLLGFRYQQARLRLVSLGLFGVTILKVFLADMAKGSTPFRIVSFVVLGLMLIGASYLYYRYRGYLLSTLPADNQL